MAAWDEYYEYGATSFKNFVWLKGGANFESPTDITIEMINAGAYGVEVWDDQGAGVLGQGQIANEHGCWGGMEFWPGSGVFSPPIAKGYDYRIRLVNHAPGNAPGPPWDSYHGPQAAVGKV